MDVTVIIPVFNDARWIGDAIGSVLDQRSARSATLVVDDGSTDDTPRVLSRIGSQITVVTRRNGGLAAARNTGIQAARTDLLIFLDADDLLSPGSLDAFLEAAERSPSADVYHCGWRGIDFATGRVLYTNEAPLAIDDDPFHGLLATGSPPIGALCVRRRAIDRAGMFDETLRLQEDWDFWLRLAVTGSRFQAVDAPPTVIRNRIDSMSMAVGKPLASTALAVAERAFEKHLPCPQCVNSHRLDKWRLYALRRSAYDVAVKLPVRGRLGHWAGMACAMAQRPRLVPAVWRDLLARWPGAGAK